MYLYIKHQRVLHFVLLSLEWQRHRLSLAFQFTANSSNIQATNFRKQKRKVSAHLKKWNATTSSASVVELLSVPRNKEFRQQNVNQLAKFMPSNGIFRSELGMDFEKIECFEIL